MRPGFGMERLSLCWRLEAREGGEAVFAARRVSVAYPGALVVNRAEGDVANRAAQAGTGAGFVQLHLAHAVFGFPWLKAWSSAHRSCEAERRQVVGLHGDRAFRAASAAIHAGGDVFGEGRAVFVG